MAFTRFEQASVFPVEVEALWRFHTGADLLQLTPSEPRIEVLDPGAGVSEGSLAHLRVREGVFRGEWTALYTAFDVYRGFTTVALDGPFPFWEHRREFEVVGRGRARLRDVIWYSLPAADPGVSAALVDEALRELVSGKHRRALELLALARPPRRSRAVHAPRALVRPGTLAH